MKVTALIPDPLIREITHYTKGKNLTESLITALREWLSLKKISRLNAKLLTHPLEFHKQYSAEAIRTINRKKR